MKVKLGIILATILLLSACAPTNQAYWQEAKNAAHYSNLGMRQARKGKYRKAIPLFEKALEIDPNLMVAREQLSLAHANLGKKYLEWQRYALAGTEFKTAIAIDPHSQIAQEGLKTATRQMQIFALGR